MNVVLGDMNARVPKNVDESDPVRYIRRRNRNKGSLLNLYIEIDFSIISTLSGTHV